MAQSNGKFARFRIGTTENRVDLLLSDTPDSRLERRGPMAAAMPIADLENGDIERPIRRCASSRGTRRPRWRFCSGTGITDWIKHRSCADKHRRACCQLALSWPAVGVRLRQLRVDEADGIAAAWTDAHDLR
jgi:hypothetical protein